MKKRGVGERLMTNVGDEVAFYLGIRTVHSIRHVGRV